MLPIGPPMVTLGSALSGLLGGVLKLERVLLALHAVDRLVRAHLDGGRVVRRGFGGERALVDRLLLYAGLGGDGVRR